jgi:hypothetical protein
MKKPFYLILVVLLSGACQLARADDDSTTAKGASSSPSDGDAENVKAQNQQDGYEDAVRMQMKMLQSMAQKYANKHGGKFPIALDDGFKNYFPQITINNSKSTSPFYNPFTKKQEWFEVKPVEKMDKTDEIQVAQKGQIIYCPLSNGTNFAIIAGARDGKLLRDKAGKVLILKGKTAAAAQAQ